ncbi:MAG: hypothetical protein RJB62_1007 [Pseudomonadota bacterium]|jgi:hypothetical protein
MSLLRLCFRFVLPASLLALIAAPASAALPEGQYIDAVMAELTTCLDANDTGVAATAASVCEAAHQRTEQLQNEQVLQPGEARDLTWYSRAVMQIHLGVAYLTLDGVRSGRSCTAAELSLQYMGNVEPTFPYPEELAASREGAYDPVRACRVDFGRPWWGLDIP